MRRIAAIGLAGIALAGCGQTNGDELANNANLAEQEQTPRAPDAGVEPPQPDGADGGDRAEADEDESAGADLPPASSQLRFVGRWASSEANCTNRAWRFTEKRLETPAGSVCTFSQVTPVGGGYDIAATCTAEGPARDDLLTIRFAESARAMLFESESIADAGLIYCGRAG